MDETNSENIGRPIDTFFDTKIIAIEGMTCDNCVRTVEKALRSVSGVQEVQVDRAQARATVKFDTRRTDIPALHDALIKKGYKPRANADGD